MTSLRAKSTFPLTWTNAVQLYLNNICEQMPLVEQEVPTLPKHLCLPPLLVGFLCSVFKFKSSVLSTIVFFSFCPFSSFCNCTILQITPSVLVYTFGIFKLFFQNLYNYLTNRQTSGESSSLPQYDEGTESAEVATSDYLTIHTYIYIILLERNRVKSLL